MSPLSSPQSTFLREVAGAADEHGVPYVIVASGPADGRVHGVALISNAHPEDLRVLLAVLDGQRDALIKRMEDHVAKRGQA